MTALVAPAAASASTTEAIANTGGMTLTIGVLGSPLNVSVTLDDIGHITEVVVDDPAFAEDRANEHKVRFTNEDDSTRVEVRAKKDKLRADVKVADLSAILGSHTWTGRLFGEIGGTVVGFEIVENGSGNPELANVAVTTLLPADATYEIGDIKNEVEDDEAGSSVKIEFVRNGYAMTLKIKAEMEFDDDDGDPSVKLRVELKGKDRQKLRDQNLTDLVGSHQWDGRLCDGTVVAVNYTVSDSGDVIVDEVTVDGAASDAYELKTKRHGFDIKFDSSHASVKLQLKDKGDGLWELKVKSKTTEKCDKQHRDKDKKRHDNDDDDDHKKDKERDDDDRKKDKERDDD